MENVQSIKVENPRRSWKSTNQHPTSAKTHPTSANLHSNSYSMSHDRSANLRQIRSSNLETRILKAKSLNVTDKMLFVTQSFMLHTT
eukprot:scaffold1697_cov120-Cylindrotheca_fusiformis.AAC.59